MTSSYWLFQVPGPGDDASDGRRGVPLGRGRQRHVEAEWTRLSKNFTTAGYRDGISSGKEVALQEGVDVAFARNGAPRGREPGVLQGVATALLPPPVPLLPRRPACADASPGEIAEVSWISSRRAGADAQCGTDKVQGQGQAHPLTTCARSARNLNRCCLRQGLTSHWASTRRSTNSSELLADHAPQRHPDTAHNSRIAHDQTFP
ncbi:hypothetical protein EDB83DRAFT_2321136 [Lactarius deliciosus]|nr:hypothetical protein EDB83DRAFT_2321136 [Lactarius deliciosus]